MKKAYPIALILLAILVLLSLILNGIVFIALLRTRRTTLAAVQDAQSAIDRISEDSISYTVQLDENLPVVTSFPFSEEIDVPINTVLPIDTTVFVPVDLGLLGTVDIEIPIRTVVPVDIDVTVPVNQTVDVVTSVPLKVNVPIEVEVSDTSLSRDLDALNRALAQLEARLEDPLGAVE